MTQLSTSKFPDGFAEKTARVNGVTLNYATGARGRPWYSCTVTRRPGTCGGR